MCVTGLETFYKMKKKVMKLCTAEITEWKSLKKSYFPPGNSYRNKILQDVDKTSHNFLFKIIIIKKKKRKEKNAVHPFSFLLFSMVAQNVYFSIDKFL